MSNLIGRPSRLSQRRPNLQITKAVKQVNRPPPAERWAPQDLADIEECVQAYLDGGFKLVARTFEAIVDARRLDRVGAMTMASRIEAMVRKRTGRPIIKPTALPAGEPAPKQSQLPLAG